jgi:hypothetical protein
MIGFLVFVILFSSLLSLLMLFFRKTPQMSEIFAFFVTLIFTL